MSKWSSSLNWGKDPEQLRQRVVECPECDSDDIGQLDEGLPADAYEYEAAGGRYYCVKCGWSEPKYDGLVGLQSWPFYWPEVECANCGVWIKEEHRMGWIDPENPERVLCYDCRDKEVNPGGWRGFLRRITGQKRRFLDDRYA